MQQQFVKRFIETVKNDPSITGAAIGGSWINGEIDEYSDVDIVLVTQEAIGGDKDRMKVYAEKFGKLLSAFTGDHVGEPRLLICMYDDPLLHVDLKFVTLKEFEVRVEDPVIVHDTNDQLRKVITTTKSQWPKLDPQWIEDRFWTWVHYAVLKIGRGEYFEALDFFAAIRSMVLGPLIHVHNSQLPRGVRKIERVGIEQLPLLKKTVAVDEPQSLLKALDAVVQLYRSLRKDLFPQLKRSMEVEKKVMDYYKEISNKINNA